MGQNEENNEVYNNLTEAIDVKKPNVKAVKKKTLISFCRNKKKFISAIQIRNGQSIWPCVV